MVLRQEFVNTLSHIRDTYYRKVGNDWWQWTTSKIYTTDNQSTTAWTGRQKRRLTGWATNVIEETVALDANGNPTTTTVTRDATDLTLFTRETHYPDVTEQGVVEQEVVRNGLVQLRKSKTGIQTTYEYDTLGRQTTVTDGRNIQTSTAYYTSGTGKKGKVHTVTNDALSQTTTYDYYPNTGRLKSVTRPDQTTVQYFAYTQRGERSRTWGHVPQPVQYDYDAWGRQTKITTYQSDGPNGDIWTDDEWPQSPPTGAETTLEYGDATNGLNRWVTRREYDNGDEVWYTYHEDGKLDTRIWERTAGNVTTTYGYHSGTREMTGVSYSDGTQGVTHTYTRAGLHDTITDAVGSREFTYRADLQVDQEMSWFSLKWRTSLPELHLSGRPSPGIERCFLSLGSRLRCEGFSA